MNREEQSLPPELEGALNRILEHPEILHAVASAFGKGTEESGASPTETRTPSSAASSEELSASLGSVAALAPLLSGLGNSQSRGASHGKGDDRACLLSALKPYVNEHRRQAIDTMLRFTQVAELLGHMGRSDSDRS